MLKVQFLILLAVIFYEPVVSLLFKFLKVELREPLLLLADFLTNV